MLQLMPIRQNKDKLVQALKKRNFDAEEILGKVLELDEQRRSLQSKLDSVLADSNKISKEIGGLFKSGKIEEANKLKEESAKLKESSRTLGESLGEATKGLEEILFQIPNIPHELVPSGSDEEDNEEVHREGDVPELDSGALPWV